jgi:hypothetical protein
MVKGGSLLRVSCRMEELIYCCIARFGGGSATKRRSGEEGEDCGERARQGLLLTVAILSTTIQDKFAKPPGARSPRFSSLVMWDCQVIHEVSGSAWPAVRLASTDRAATGGTFEADDRGR